MRQHILFFRLGMTIQLIVILFILGIRICDGFASFRFASGGWRFGLSLPFRSALHGLCGIENFAHLDFGIGTKKSIRPKL